MKTNKIDSLETCKIKNVKKKKILFHILIAETISTPAKISPNREDASPYALQGRQLPSQ
jgi:hypothetical protein